NHEHDLNIGLLLDASDLQALVVHRQYHLAVALRDLLVREEDRIEDLLPRALRANCRQRRPDRSSLVLDRVASGAGDVEPVEEDLLPRLRVASLQEVAIRVSRRLDRLQSRLDLGGRAPGRGFAELEVEPRWKLAPAIQEMDQH